MTSVVWRLWSVCLSVTYVGNTSRTERPRKTKIGTHVAHVTRNSDITFKVKGQGHQAALVGCSSNYIIYMDDTIFYATTQSELLPVDHEYLWRAGHCRRKACGLELGCSVRWTGVGAYCVASHTAWYTCDRWWVNFTVVVLLVTEDGQITHLTVAYRCICAYVLGYVRSWKRRPWFLLCLNCRWTRFVLLLLLFLCWLNRWTALPAIAGQPISCAFWLDKVTEKLTHAYCLLSLLQNDMLYSDWTRASSRH